MDRMSDSIRRVCFDMIRVQLTPPCHRLQRCDIFELRFLTIPSSVILSPILQKRKANPQPHLLDTIVLASGSGPEEIALLFPSRAIRHDLYHFDRS